ncbi:MAG: GAF domain-containing protein [Acidobacteriota bacterium]|nr:GAF domain-containing protein [Acidobacteriota bacterium]
MSAELAERRLAALAEIARRTRLAASPADVLAAAHEVLSAVDPGIPFWNLRAPGVAREQGLAEGRDVREFGLGDSATLAAAIAPGDTWAFVELIACQLNEALRGNRLGALVRASAALLVQPEALDLLPRLLELAGRFVYADAYALWRRQNDEGLWIAAAVEGLSGAYARSAYETNAHRPMPAETLVFEDVAGQPFLHSRQDELRGEGIRSMLYVPLRIQGAPSGSLVFYYRTPRKFSADDRNLATALGNLAAAAIEISELYRAQDEERKRAMFLASAGAVLGSSLDVETTLNAIARLAVPEIADWCTIDLLDADGSLRRVSIAHSDPDRAARARALFERNPVKPDSPLFSILDGLRGVLGGPFTDEYMRAGARSEEHLAALRSARVNSSIVAPLYARGEKFGLLSFYRSEPRKPYDKRDLALAEELAARAALAIHSARLHRVVAESAERLRISADAADLGIFDWDLETGSVLWENHRMFEIFGRDPVDGPIREEEFFNNFLHSADREPFRRNLTVRLQGDAKFQMMCRIVRGDGEQRVVEFSGRVDLPGASARKRLIGVVADVTERRRLEERLREAAKLESIGLLAGGVAHDFNNLLTGIMGHASLALEFLEPEHPARSMVRNALTAGERAAVLTRQMLAYSGRGKFVLKPIDLSELVREIEGLIGISTPGNAEVSLDLAGGLPEVYADPAEMQQLVMNLIINAVESLEGRPGRVSVRTALCELGGDRVERMPETFEIRPGRYVQLEVSDTGCGMTKETLGRIFDPFFTTKFTGRGLGLSAAQGIVRGHKGSIEVESEIGRGTTFRVFLPPNPGEE